MEFPFQHAEDLFSAESDLVDRPILQTLGISCVWGGGGRSGHHPSTHSAICVRACVRAVNTMPLDDTAFVAPFVACTDKIARQAVELAGLRATDVVVDLGCGDGQILAEALNEFMTMNTAGSGDGRGSGGGSIFGVELDPFLYRHLCESLRSSTIATSTTTTTTTLTTITTTSKKAGSPFAHHQPVVTDEAPHSFFCRYEIPRAAPGDGSSLVVASHVQLHVLEQDMFAVDLVACGATVLILYLLPQGLGKLKPMLQKWFADGNSDDHRKRIVTIQYEIPGWNAIRQRTACSRIFHYYDRCSMTDATGR